MEAAPGLSIDPATLVLSISMLGFLMAAVSWSTASGIPNYRAGLIEWGKAMAAIGGGFLLYFLRGQAPWVLTFLVSNVLVLSVAYFYHQAHAELLKVTPRRKHVGAISAFGISGVLASYFFDAPRQLAAFTLSSAIATILVMTAWLIFRNIGRRPMPSSRIAAGTALAMATGFGSRAVLSIVGNAASVSPASSSAAQIGTLITGALFTVASSIAFFSMVHERLRQETLESSRRDGLTGLYNRAAFFEKAEEVEKETDGSRYSMVMVDIDHFKAINDTYGHMGGDIALAHAARLIASSVRISDVAGRYGGEEFCILLCGCGQEEAAQFARRLVADASHQVVRLRDGRSVAYMLSAGYATSMAVLSDASGRETVSEVIERADQALYQAKRNGRNQAVAAATVLSLSEA